MTRHSTDLAHTDLVKVAFANDQVGAEFLQGLLDDAEIPSVVLRAPGFDVPDLLAVGPRDVFVSATDAELARDVLKIEEPEATPVQARAMPSRVLAGVLIVAALLAACACVAADVLA